MFLFMQSLMDMVVPSVRSTSTIVTIIYRFCANYLHSAIENSINTSPYKEDSTKCSRSGSFRKGDKRSTSGFLREMDIVNGFQLCDARYRNAVTKGILWYSNKI